MFLSNKDLILLSDIDFYLSELEGEKANELEDELSKLIEKLEVKRVERNAVNAKKIANKRLVDKNYARSKINNNNELVM